MRIVRTTALLTSCLACAGGSGSTSRGTATSGGSATSGTTGGMSDLPSQADVVGWAAPLIDGGFIHGMVIGIVDQTGSALIGLGVVGDGGSPPNGTTLFQVAGLTSTFTGLWLAIDALDGGLHLSDPAQQFLPNTVTLPTADGGVITLGDLATHTSALYSAPSNLDPPDPLNPWAAYTVEDLFTFLNGFQLPYAPGTKYTYSDIGDGLLGLTLSLPTGADYNAGVQQLIAGPLGLVDTTAVPTASQLSRLAPPHDGDLNSAEVWSWTEALAGSGELYSTVNDLMVLGEAESGISSGGSLSAAMTLSQQINFTPPSGDALGLGWFVNTDGIVWQNGDTYGESGFIGILPNSHRCVVVLADTASSTTTAADGSLPATVGFRILHWLEGVPPPALSTLLPSTAVLTPTQLQQFEGAYSFADAGYAQPLSISVNTEGNGLVASANDWLWYYPIDLYPTASNVFVLRTTTGQLTFDLDTTGVTGVDLVQPDRSIVGVRQ